jgi:uncharacterized heparinase superfamily protein
LSPFSLFSPVQKVTNPLQLYQTVRYLEPRQVYGQLQQRLWRPSCFTLALPLRIAPEYPGCRWRPLRDFLPPGAQRNSRGELLRGRFQFLNQRLELGWPPQWDPAEASKLWVYNLHYFEWLWALEYPEAKQAVADWLERGSSAARGAWEPYPLSLRVMNWCALFWQRWRPQLEQDLEFRQKLWQSLYLQLEWLPKHLESHLLGNHLLENAAALALVGAAFSGADAARWFLAGERLLRQQLPVQMLTDGMHFERSPMYHVRATFLLLLLTGTGSRRLATLIEPFLERALDAMAAMLHPDGDIALFNDSAFGINCAPDRLLRFAEALGFRTRAETHAGQWSLPAAGYYGCRSPHSVSIICDAGAIGPDYLPGHAHGDIFSFELSCGAARIIVDSGVYDYLPSDMRRYCRSTAAHNTVAIDNQDQCEFWQAFRVARRGRPHDVQWQPLPGGFRLRGWHDGYCRLPAHPVHRRQFTYDRSGVLMVRDKVDARASVQAVSRIHLHPDCELVRVSRREAAFNTPAGLFIICFCGKGRLTLETSWYCPEFGKQIPNQALAWTIQGANTSIGFCFAPGWKIDRFDLTTGVTIGRRRFPW